MSNPYPQQPQQLTYPSLTPGEPPLWAPHYGANARQALKRFFKKYATFTGRASRSEFWWWAFVYYLFIGVLWFIGLAQRGSTIDYVTILMLVWLLGVTVPMLALIARRLHDANLSGWFMFLGSIPFVGTVVLLIFMLLPPKPAGQRFDQPPAP
ncbi:DUF805 domain-containing protein [Sinomonas sp. G460-2]|uniref:DUF805 domain-containing protein n=1 Tax=Sinomonas sp. G460-2 TaxID=3393464 RepID=UPI0039EFFD42